MTELEILEEYLEKHGTFYEKKKMVNKGIVYRNQIIVYDDKGKRLWDVICQVGSYGFDEGRLEGMGIPGSDDSLDVEGWMTADEIIKRLEKEQ